MYKKKLSPFEQGKQAAQSYSGSWFDCPYTGGTVRDAFNRKRWLDGWDAGRLNKTNK